MSTNRTLAEFKKAVQIKDETTVEATKEAEASETENETVDETVQSVETAEDAENSEEFKTFLQNIDCPKDLKEEIATRVWLEASVKLLESTPSQQLQKDFNDVQTWMKSANLPTFSFRDFTFKKVGEEYFLGEGSSAMVVKAHFADGIKPSITQPVAIKILTTGEKAKEFQNEVRILSALDDPTIVKFHGVCITPPCIIMEACKSPLDDFLEDNSDSIDWPVKIKFALDAAKAVRYLHGKGYLQNDIKGGNFVVADEKDSSVKLIDFNLSTTLEDKQKCIVGTPAFIAPEILFTKYSQKSDIFSLGVTFAQIASNGEEFFEGDADKKIFSEMLKGKRPDLPKQTPKLFKAVIEEMWQHSAAKRPTADEVVKKLEEIIATKSYGV